MSMIDLHRPHSEQQEGDQPMLVIGHGYSIEEDLREHGYSVEEPDLHVLTASRALGETALLMTRQSE